MPIIETFLPPLHIETNLFVGKARDDETAENILFGEIILSGRKRITIKVKFSFNKLDTIAVFEDM